MTRAVKAGALTLGIGGLLLLVALAARGGHQSGAGRISQREVTHTLQDSLVTLLALVYAVAIVAIVIGLFRYRGEWHEPRSRWFRNFCAVLVLMSVITAVGYWAMRHGNLRERAQQAQSRQAQQQGRQGGRRPSIRPVPARPAKFEWPLVFAIVGLVVIGGAVVVLRERRPLSPIRGGGRLEAELAEAVDTTIEDLRGERDARRAVIAAYAQMERVLAAHGIARHRAETPFEYLARILRELHVRESAVRPLTQLFEYAKFSGHAIDAGMKEEAIAALGSVRDDLRRDEAVAA